MGVVLQKFQSFFQSLRFENGETHEVSGTIVFVVSTCFQKEPDLFYLREAILEVDEEHCLSLEDSGDERDDKQSGLSLLVSGETTDILNKKACWFHIIFPGGLNKKQVEENRIYLYNLAEKLAKKGLWYVEEVSAMIEVKNSISFLSSSYWDHK